VLAGLTDPAIGLLRSIVGRASDAAKAS